MAEKTRQLRQSRGWVTKLLGVRHAVLPSQTTRPNPLVVGELVFASIFAPGAVCAVARRTGKLLWRKELDAYGSASLLVQGRTLYGNSNRTLYALDQRTGSARWQYSPISEPGEWIYSSPSIRSGRIFIGDRRGYLHCLDAKTGTELWRRLTSRGCNNQVNSTALVVKDRVITANNEGVVVCYSTESGKTIWRQNVDGACIQELVPFRSKVIVAADSLYSIDQMTGEVCDQWSFPLKTVRSVAIAGSRIAVVLGTNFHAHPEAWDKPSAFNGELVIIEQSKVVAKSRLKGIPALRLDAKGGLLYAVTQSTMSVISPLNAKTIQSRRGHFAMPTISELRLYGLSVNGVLFSETAR